MSKTSTRSSTASSASASSGTKTAASETNKPAHTIRYRNLRATIWKNAGQTGDFYSVTLSRSYQDKAEQWHDITGTFNTADLPTVAKLCNDAHSWIIWAERRTKDEAAKAGGTASGGQR